MSNKQIDLVETKVRAVIDPLVKAFVVHPKSAKIVVTQGNIGVYPGVLVEIQPDQSDARRIIGKARRNFTSFETVVRTIGIVNGVNVEMLPMKQPVVETRETGRAWKDRNAPIDGMPPIEYIKNLLAIAVTEMFPGRKPEVSALKKEGGVLDLIIKVPPSNPKAMQIKWEALKTIFVGICAPYGWLPTLKIQELDQV